MVSGRVKYGCAILLIIVAFAMFSCTTDYVTGKRTFSLMSEGEEIQMGREADPQIISEFGLYDDPKLPQFISQLGKSLAGVSQRPNLQYKFRVLDSPVVNAFALPGGYVYVTRGIIAYLNSEDELAGVLGHEIGHVVARHSAEQISKAKLAGLGLGLGSILWEDFSKYADFARTGVGILFLSFSRKQESESDMLGVEYSTRLGYDAENMADFFRTLKRMSSSGGRSLPSFLLTHPDPGDRELRVRKLAVEWQKKVTFIPQNKTRMEYLKRVDGIVYGEDPRHGFVSGKVFYHPQLAFKFPVPDNWKLVNSAGAVTIEHPDKKAIVKLTLGQAASNREEADDFIKRNGLEVQKMERGAVHGFPALIVLSKARTRNETIDLLSYFIRKKERTFVLTGMAGTTEFSRMKPEFTYVMEGFSEVNDPVILNKKPKRLRIEKAVLHGTLEDNLKALGVSDKMMEEHALFNGKSLDEKMKMGTWIKTVK